MIAGETAVKLYLETEEKRGVTLEREDMTGR